MMIHRPDFIVIGAMKSATTTLHEQLARQPGIFMSRPKEPNFFSDDEFYTRGRSWYAAIFDKAGQTELRGESSTHYAKLPTYPRTVERMVRHLPHLKLIYLMRHPIDRLMSQYVHEVTAGRINVGVAARRSSGIPNLLTTAVTPCNCSPSWTRMGSTNVLPVFFPRLVRHSQFELERIGRFLGHRGVLRWDESLGPQNVGRRPAASQSRATGTCAGAAACRRCGGGWCPGGGLSH